MLYFLSTHRFCRVSCNTLLDTRYLCNATFHAHAISMCTECKDGKCMITAWHVVPKTVLPGALLQGHIPVEIKIQKDSENYLKMTSLKSLNKQVFSSETNASPWPKQQNKMPTPTRKRTKDQQKGAEGQRSRDKRLSELWSGCSKPPSVPLLQCITAVPQNGEHWWNWHKTTQKGWN